MLETILQELAQALAEAGNEAEAEAVALAVRSGKGEMTEFLVSDELWGGSGSIADQAGIDASRRRRVKIEQLLVRLGEEQLSRGIVNPRTESWIDVFRQH